MKKVFKTLKTEYFDRVDRSMPWSEYPRPSMVRESYLCLNGYWDFCISDENLPTEYSEKILVPYPPESLLSGIERQIPENKFIFYRRKFDLPKGFLKDRFILHFGAVDTVSEVYFNGRSVIKHEGGYLPFSADCTELLKETDNEITVKVKGDLTRVYPYGKKCKKRGGMWYTPTSGIWQTVWAESVPEKYILSTKTTTDTQSAKIVANGAKEDAVLTVLQTGEQFIIKDGSFNVTPKEKHLWSPEDPYLYEYEILSGVDKVRGYFALREIGIGEFKGIKRLTLNGKPYLFNGLLDQGYFPDGILLPATLEAYENDIMQSKRLGFNMLRKHIKIEPELFYHLCDKLGMIVFQDMVNNANYSFLFDTALPTIGMKRFPDALLHRNKKTRNIFTRHMLETFDHLQSFPCILYYTIFNEGWGQFTADKLYRIAKERVSDRIIDSTSGWFTQKESDVDSRHVYFKPVVIKNKSDRPIVISEFGGYSHRVEGHLFGENNYGYRLLSTPDQLNDAFEKLYIEEILPGIEKGISGLVYTQVSDVEDETNGIMTYDRAHVKLDPERTRSIMNKLYSEMERATK